MSTAVHEASHCACAVLFGCGVDRVELDVGHALAGERRGYASIPIADEIEPSQVVVCLVGYMSEGEEGWPPAYEAALAEDRESLGLVLLRLGVTEEQYERFVEMARELLADEDFRRLRDCIARSLSVARCLEREDIEQLCRVSSVPIPEQTGATA